MYKHIELKEITAGYCNDNKIMIACVNKTIISTFFSDWYWLNLGAEVSEKLIKLPKEQRNKNIVDIVMQVINNLKAERIIIENIDILFSPELNLDVVKLLIMAGKTKERMIVIWNGMYKDDSLIYAEPGYEDYHCYVMKNYDAYCITK